MPSTGASIERLLLDTHAFLWALFDPERLSKRVRGWLADPNTVLYLSVASVWEMQLKHRKGKLEAEPAIVDEKMRELKIHPLAITVPHVRALAAFSDTVHKDPFDRLIGAQAIVENLPLATADPAFSDYREVKIRW